MDTRRVGCWLWLTAVVLTLTITDLTSAYMHAPMECCPCRAHPSFAKRSDTPEEVDEEEFLRWGRSMPRSALSLLTAGGADSRKRSDVTDAGKEADALERAAEANGDPEFLRRIALGKRYLRFGRSP